MVLREMMLVFTGQKDIHINIWTVLSQSVRYQSHFVTVRPLAHDSVIECWRNKILVSHWSESTHALRPRKLSEYDFTERCRRQLSENIWVK